MGNQHSNQRHIFRKPWISREKQFEFVRVISDVDDEKKRESRIIEVKDKEGNFYACKTTDKSKFDSDPLKCYDFRQEIDILEYLQPFPHVISYLGSFEDKHAIHIVMEMCSGGNIEDRIKERKNCPFSEDEACLIFKQIILAVHHCHIMGVVHRDVNAENIMFKDKNDNSIRMIDFGFSSFFEHGDLFRRNEGWDSFMAPEVHGELYGEECDIWSSGAVLYALLDGEVPYEKFPGNDTSRDEAIMAGKIDVGRLNVSEATKDFLKLFFNLDPGQRPTFSQIFG